MNLSPREVNALHILAGQDDWLSAEETHLRGLGGSATGAGILLTKLVRKGIVDCKRTRTSREGPNRYKLTVHGFRVLEEELTL